MDEKTIQIGIFILWITTIVECNSTALITEITCSGTQLPCGNKFCYDPATQFCSETGSVVACIKACGSQCYNSDTHACKDGVVCPIGQDVCEVRYDTYSGVLIEPPLLQCYDPWSQRCLNHTICYEKDRVCNGQCVLYTSYYQYQVCANDNKTLCTVSYHYTKYEPNQIQICNDSCFDTEKGLQRCVNGSVQCVSNCSNICYNATTQICTNGTVCNPWEDACFTNYSSVDGYSLSLPKSVCHDPRYSKCIEGALCSNHRICDGQCITGYDVSHRVCANDKRTTCNVTNHFSNYRPYQMHVCNGICYDTSLQQCIGENISCIDDACNGTCYNSAAYVCLNNTLCSIGADVCEVRYDTYSGVLIEPPLLQCYDPWSQRCLNHTICYEKDRVCNGQCILYTSYYQYQVCANDNKTLCTVSYHYTNYEPNRIQVCNGSCFDIEKPPLRHCLDGIVQCVSNCSNKCYNKDYNVCLNETLCSIGSELCDSGSARQCYNALYSKCLKGTVCSSDRVCDEQCIRNDYQVCASDKKTVCNVSKPYYNYRPNQIQICLGVCFDSLIQQCSGEHVVLCIHDPETQQCVPQNVNSSTTTTTTATVISLSTINDVSLHADNNISGLLISASTVKSPISTDDAESTSSIISLSATIRTPSLSTPSSHTSLSPTPVDFPIETGSYEPKTTITATYPTSSSSFKQSLSSSFASEGTNVPSMVASSSTTSINTGTEPVTNFTSTDMASNLLLNSSESSSSSLESTDTSSILLNVISTTTTTQLDSGTSSVSTDTPSHAVSHTSSDLTLEREKSSPVTQSTISTTALSSSLLSEDTNISPIFLSASSRSTATEIYSAISSISADTSPNPLSSVSNSISSTTDSSAPTTAASFTSVSPTQVTGCTTEGCTNTTDFCVPHVELRCSHQSKTRENNQACKAIVIGEHNNNSFVVAIAITDKKVIVIKNNHLLVLLLSIGITFLLLLSITISICVVKHRKKISISCRLWYLSVKKYIRQSQQRQWENHRPDDSR